MRIGKNQRMALEHAAKRHGLFCFPVYNSNTLLDVLDGWEQRRLFERLVERGLLSLRRDQLGWYYITPAGREAIGELASEEEDDAE